MPIQLSDAQQVAQFKSTQRVLKRISRGLLIPVLGVIILMSADPPVLSFIVFFVFWIVVAVYVAVRMIVTRCPKCGKHFWGREDDTEVYPKACTGCGLQLE